MDLSRFPRRRYTIGATPLEFLPNFTRALSPDGQGPNIWIKRDDMLGLFPGGNKTRKLEFLVADALAQGADTLITCGAPQSNHCRITLAAAVKEGLKCRFVIEERVPGSFHEDASGNPTHQHPDRPTRTLRRQQAPHDDGRSETLLHVAGRPKDPRPGATHNSSPSVPC